MIRSGQSDLRQRAPLPGVTGRKSSVGRHVPTRYTLDSNPSQLLEWTIDQRYTAVL
jgi:hypothetical protein